MDNRFTLLDGNPLEDPNTTDLNAFKDTKDSVEVSSVEDSEEEGISPQKISKEAFFKWLHNPVKDNPILQLDMGSVLEAVSCSKKNKSVQIAPIGPASNNKSGSENGGRSVPPSK